MTPLCSNTAALNFAVWILAFMHDRTGLYHLAGMQPILDASNSLSGCDGQSIHWAERGKAGIHCHVAGTVQLKICTHICIHNYTADQEWRCIAIYTCADIVWYMAWILHLIPCCVILGDHHSACPALSCFTANFCSSQLHCPASQGAALLCLWKLNSL